MNKYVASCVLALVVLASTGSAVRAQIDNRNYLYVSNHNMVNDQSGIVRVDKRTGEQLVITQGLYIADNDLFGIVPESPTTLLAMDVGMGWSQKIVRVNVVTMQQELVLQSQALESPCTAALGPDGFLYVANNGWLGAQGSIIKVNLATKEMTTVVVGGRPSGLLFHPNGKLFCINTNYSADVYTFSTIDLSAEKIEMTPFNNDGLMVRPGGMALDTDGSILLADMGNPAVLGDNKILRMHPETGTQTVLSSAVGANQFSGLMVDSTGEIFALDTSNPGGRLAVVYRVDRNTGALTVVSPQPGQTQYLWGTSSVIELPVAPNPCAELEEELSVANARIQELDAKAAAAADAIESINAVFRSEFKNQTFVVPGQGLVPQILALAAAIDALNHGEKNALYKNLGGSK